MHTRRGLICIAAAMVAAAFVAGAGDAVGAASAGAESLSRLKAGNARFVANPEDALLPTAARRSALAQGQTPFATILSCADSRVPPEIIFRASLGDLFVVRAAGNITDKAILASVEYAAEHLHTPLIVVMGHEACGAVKATFDTPATKSLGPNLDYLLKAIRPSTSAALSKPESERMRAAILANVEETLNDMIEGSAILREMGKSGRVMFVGAYYELASGKVYFSQPADLGGAPAPAAATPTGDHHQ